jgi:hypothetical protein
VLSGGQCRDGIDARGRAVLLRLGAWAAQRWESGCRISRRGSGGRKEARGASNGAARVNPRLRYLGPPRHGYPLCPVCRCPPRTAEAVCLSSKPVRWFILAARWTDWPVVGGSRCLRSVTATRLFVGSSRGRCGSHVLTGVPSQPSHPFECGAVPQGQLLRRTTTRRQQIPGRLDEADQFLTGHQVHDSTWQLRDFLRPQRLFGVVNFANLAVRTSHLLWHGSRGIEDHHHLRSLPKGNGELRR